MTRQGIYRLLLLIAGLYVSVFITATRLNRLGERFRFHLTSPLHPPVRPLQPIPHRGSCHVTMVPDADGMGCRYRCSIHGWL